MQIFSSGYRLLLLYTTLEACWYSCIWRKGDADVEGWFVDIVVLIAANTSARCSAAGVMLHNSGLKFHLAASSLIAESRVDSSAISSQNNVR
jgi:hypothetical protein